MKHTFQRLNQKKKIQSSKQINKVTRMIKRKKEKEKEGIINVWMITKKKCKKTYADLNSCFF